jgi:hypothetical protein
MFLGNYSNDSPKGVKENTHDPRMVEEDLMVYSRVNILVYYQGYTFTDHLPNYGQNLRPYS